MPVLLARQCRSERGRSEEMLRRAGLHVSFQWPKESMEFVRGVREKVERMGYKRNTFYSRVRLIVVEGRVTSGQSAGERREESLSYWPGGGCHLWTGTCGSA